MRNFFLLLSVFCALNFCHAEPIGTVVMWPSETPPDGWLLCNGVGLSVSTYSNLYAVIGTQYNTNVPSGIFVLPDLRGRVAVGQFSSGTFASLGAKGGAEVVTLTTNQMPSHRHRSVPGDIYKYVASGGGQVAPGVGTNLKNFNIFYTDFVGGDESHQNMPPYIVLNYIIKYAFLDSEISGLSLWLNNLNECNLWNMKILLWIFGGMLAALCSILFFKV